MNIQKTIVTKTHVARQGLEFSGCNCFNGMNIIVRYIAFIMALQLVCITIPLSADAETLTVPADGSVVYSTTLSEYSVYTITASGVFCNNNTTTPNHFADAAGYNSFSDYTEQTPVLHLNGGGIDWQDFPSSPDHEYTATISGQNGPVGFSISDSYYGDNYGSLTVTITASFTGDSNAPTVNNNPASSTSEPINAATGAFYSTRRLLTLHGGRELGLEMSYDSILLNQGVLGIGWSHNFEAGVQNNGGTAIVWWNTNRFNNYAATTIGGSTYVGTDNDVKYDTLAQLADNSWVLTKQDQERLIFDSIGRLVRWEDKYGRALVITHSGASPCVSSVIEPISGQSITFGYTNINEGIQLARVVASDGRKVLFNYDSSGAQLLSQCIQSADGLNSSTYNYTYDSSGRILTVVAPDGNTILVNTYDPSGKIATQQDGVSPAITVGTATIPAKTAYTTTLTYDETSEPGYRITTVTNRTGGVQVFTHDSMLELVSHTDELGRTISYTYDTNGNVLSKTDARGYSTCYQYDAGGNVTQITDANSNVTVMAYDGANNLLSATNAMGETRSYTYGANNLLSSATDALGNQTTYQYDTNSLPILIISPRGGQTSMVNNGGLPVSVLDPNGDLTQYAYDAAGRVASKIDPDGYQWNYGYDLLDHQTMIQDPLGNRTSKTYNYLGKITQEVDPLGNTTQYFYDANGNLLAVSNAIGGVTVYGYDPEDRNTSVVDALGHTNVLSYDPAGQLVSVRNALNQSYSYSYDANGNLLQAIDSLGRPIYTAAYSPINRPAGNADSLGNSTTFTLDAVGRRIGQTDPLGRTQLFNRDKNGRLVAVQTPLNTTASQTFDKDGNRTAIANPVGAATTFTYDLGGRLTMMSSPMGRKTSYGYDRRGLLASLTKPSGQQAAFSYDPAGRMTQWVDPVGTINYGYDNKGRLLTVSENGKTILRAYDALDRITRYVDIFSNEIQYAYDAAGNLTNLTYPGGNQVRYSYDAANRMLSLTDWTGRTTSFAYDTNGLLAQIARPNGTMEVRSYDSNQRLNMLAELDASRSATSQTVLTWDATGQLVGEAVTPTPVFVMPAQANMTYDLDDRLTSWNGQTVASDADGNSITVPLAQGIQSLSFDARNRLTSTPTQSFEYDAEGMRVMVSESGITNWFINNPNTKLSQMLMKTSSTGVTNYYIYGASGLLYVLEGTSAKYYRYDTRDNTVATMDDTGATIAQYAYSPYGQVQSQPTGTSDLFMFAGRSGVQTDSSGLLYMRARYYSPYSRRFVSQDPLFGQITTVASLNHLVYANGSPIMFDDPLGLCGDSPQTSNGLTPVMVAAIKDLLGQLKPFETAMAFYDLVNAPQDDPYAITDAAYSTVAGMIIPIYGTIKTMIDQDSPVAEWLTEDNNSSQYHVGNVTETYYGVTRYEYDSKGNLIKTEHINTLTIKNP